MKTFTYTQQAWVTSPSELDRLLANKAGDLPSIQLPGYDMSSEGWIMVGQATITVNLLDHKAMIDQSVAQLQQAINKVRADSSVKIMKLNEMLSNLLCIENNPSAPAAEITEWKSYAEVPPTKASDLIDDIPF